MVYYRMLLALLTEAALSANRTPDSSPPERHARADVAEEQKMAALEDAVLLWHQSRPERDLANWHGRRLTNERAKIQEELAAAQKAYEPAQSKLAAFPAKDYGLRSPSVGGAVSYSIATRRSDR